MSNETPAPIVSDAEIEAALSEAESDSADIPSLDDGGRGVVHVPVDASPPRPRNAPSAPSDRVAVAAKLPADKPPKPARRRGLGWLSAPIKRLAAILSVWLRALPGVELVIDLAGSAWQAARAAADWLLTLLNRPFEWMSPEARRLVGFLAMVTIVMSLLAGALLPRLYPPRDAITQLTSQTQEVESPEGGGATRPEGG